jgi:hypothetical protein
MIAKHIATVWKEYMSYTEHQRLKTTDFRAFVDFKR